MASIAKRYGTSVRAMRAANRMKRAEVKVGQTLRVPITKVSATASSSRPTSVPEVVTVYRAKKGDTLSRIASRFGLSAAELKRINGLKKDTITVGQVIKVRGEPKANTKKRAAMSAPRVTYVVKKNDTLMTIANRYNVDVDKLKDLNNIKGNGTYIKVGQKLVIN